MRETREEKLVRMKDMILEYRIKKDRGRSESSIMQLLDDACFIACCEIPARENDRSGDRCGLNIPDPDSNCYQGEPYRVIEYVDEFGRYIKQESFMRKQ